MLVFYNNKRVTSKRKKEGRTREDVEEK